MALRGFIANTDYDWYRFLSAEPRLAEVNFWQPSAGRGFRAIPPGAPFFFRLKHPHRKIAGFGCFARHSVLPAWLAWESFERANGAADMAAMWRLIERNRHGSRTGGPADSRIGCLMITEPVFFDREAWVDQPAGWSPNIVQGASLDLTVGEGLRIWSECRDRAMGAASSAGVALLAGSSRRFGAPQLVSPRLGQGTFRVFVTEAYGGACAVTAEHSLPALEAAHIRPWADGGEHAVPNGILLRSDIHRLFDRGYVTITPEHRFLVSRRLKEDFDNGRSYNDLHGRLIHPPARSLDHPDPGLLEWHARERYLG